MNGAGGLYCFVYFPRGETDQILRRIIDRTIFSCQNITMTESTETDQNSDQVISNLLYLIHLGEM